MNYPESYSNGGIASTTGPNPWTMGNYLLPQSTYPDPVFAPGYPSPARSYVPDFNAADDVAYSLTPTSEMGAFALPIQADFINQNVLDPWSMPGPSYLDANSAVSQPQLVGDQYWTGVDPHSAATTPDSGVSPTSTTLTSLDEDEWAWVSNILQTPCTTPASSPEYRGEAWVAPEPCASISEVTTSPAGWDASGYFWPIPAPGDVTSNATTTLTPAVASEKRRREAEQPLGDGGPAGTRTHEMPPPKRAKGGGAAEGIPKAARSITRTRRKPTTRTPRVTINSKPKEAGRGAERLATPNSQGIYH